MNKLFLISILLLCLLLSNCNNKSKNEYKNENAANLIRTQDKEDFNVFFRQFQKDSVFQINRIEFPIKYYIYESGSYMDEQGNVIDLGNKEIVINKNEWKYKNFKGYLKDISINNEKEYNVELQMEDTGISVNYIFKMHNNKWYLVEIKDESN